MIFQGTASFILLRKVNMLLPDTIHKYVSQPYPLWETTVTQILVHQKWEDLKKGHLQNPSDYSTARSISGANIPLEGRLPITNEFKSQIIFLENPSPKYLGDFYNEHGLCPCTESELTLDDSMTKLKSAMEVFDLVEPASQFFKMLVRSVQVLKQEDPEIDMSYSHPLIPFSIFISVCPDNSMVSSLRVAESILHESMHLKLSLIENVIPMVKANTGNLYYSPWREEKRPAQGLLHGLFVFRAIFDFFTTLNARLDSDIAVDYIIFRKEQIMNEMLHLKDFHLCPDLTADGAILTKNLLPLS
jgi:hypothetical protein